MEGQQENGRRRRHKIVIGGNKQVAGKRGVHEGWRPCASEPLTETLYTIRYFGESSSLLS